MDSMEKADWLKQEIYKKKGWPATNTAAPGENISGDTFKGFTKSLFLPNCQFCHEQISLLRCLPVYLA